MQKASQEPAKIFIRQKAFELGFCARGISRAELPDQEARPLDGWLHGGLQGPRAYMKNHFELRTDVRELVPDAKSVITLGCDINKFR